MPAKPSRHAPSRLNHAIRLWRGYVEAPRLAQLDRWLAAEMKQNRQFGKRDRRGYSEILFSAVRFGYLAVFLEFAHGRLDPNARGGLTSFLTESLGAFRAIEPEAALEALRKLEPMQLLHLVGLRHQAEGGDWPLAGATDFPLLDSLFDAFVKLRLDSPAPELDLLWAGVPLGYSALLNERVGRGWSRETVAGFLERQASRPPLWLRLNHPERRAEVLAELSAAGLTVGEHDEALQVAGDRGIYELAAYREGRVEIQDWASQRIGAAVAAEPGERIWDACAGGGGKTVQLAAQLSNRGALYASDIREYKLAEVRRRVVRAGYDNVRLFPWNGEAPPSLTREVQGRGGFDRVLVDAPCTASGTWRRNPDTRFRFSAESLAEFVALQGRLLRQAAPALRPSGRLVYSTCSWLVDENEAVVEAFLAENEGFELIEQGLHGAPEVDADTMFIAVLRSVKERP